MLFKEASNLPDSLYLIIHLNWVPSKTEANLPSDVQTQGIDKLFTLGDMLILGPLPRHPFPALLTISEPELHPISHLVSGMDVSSLKASSKCQLLPSSLSFPRSSNLLLALAPKDLAGRSPCLLQPMCMNRYSPRRSDLCFPDLSRHSHTQAG